MESVLIYYDQPWSSILMMSPNKYDYSLLTYCLIKSIPSNKKYKNYRYSRVWFMSRLESINLHCMFVEVQRIEPPPTPVTIIAFEQGQMVGTPTSLSPFGRWLDMSMYGYFMFSMNLLFLLFSWLVAFKSFLIKGSFLQTCKSQLNQGFEIVTIE